jgi:pyridoxine 5'-phosphate synthase PdxJ
VKLTATNSNDFNQAKSLVEDLVRAVVEVGIDVSLADEPESVRIAASKEIRIVDLA